VIERKEVEYVARLARDLTDVLDHIAHIEQLDLEGVAPTSHVVRLENVLREDQIRPSLTPEQALKSAPETADGGFAVPTPGS